MEAWFSTDSFYNYASCVIEERMIGVQEERSYIDD